MRALVLVAAGAVSALGFAPVGWWPLMLIGMAVLAWHVVGAATMRAAAWRGALFAFGQFVVGLNWIAGSFRYQDAMPVWFGWGAVGALSLYLAVYMAIGMAAAWLARASRTGFALAFGGGWAIAEYLRGTMFTGFAWNPVGVAMIDTRLLHLAPFVGTYGMSAVTATLAATGALLAARAANAWDQRRVDAGGIARGDGVALALLLILVATLGAPRPPASREPATTAPRLRIVQPNIGQSLKQDPNADERNFATYARLTGPPTDQPRVVVWSESSVPWLIEDELWARRRLANLLGPADALLLGGDAVASGGLANAAFALTPDARLTARWDKAHLVPYGEYLPMRPLLSALGLSRVVPGGVDFIAGPGPRTHLVPGLGTVGVQICYEIIFSGEVVDRAHRPAFLYNPSNDAWFGAWGPPQHLAQARLRAAEEAMPIVRATPTGISAVIDASGHVRASLPLGAQGVIDATVPAAAPPTPFARWGNLLALGLAAAMLVIGVAVARRHR